MTTTESVTTGERSDLLEALASARFFLRFTTQGLSDEQATQRTTVSELTLAGLIKHVTEMEKLWLAFAHGDTATVAGSETREEEFRMLPGETLAGLLDRYEEQARRTDDFVVSAPDLDLSYPLPEAPWFEPGKRWSLRRVLQHLVAETAQHAGHADIIRESLDGQRTMG